MKVKVKKVPVRHNGKNYKPGEIFEMDEKHFNAAIVDKVAAPENKKSADKEKAPKE